MAATSCLYIQSQPIYTEEQTKLARNDHREKALNHALYATFGIKQGMPIRICVEGVKQKDDLPAIQGKIDQQLNLKIAQILKQQGCPEEDAVLVGNNWGVVIDFFPGNIPKRNGGGQAKVSGVAHLKEDYAVGIEKLVSG